METLTLPAVHLAHEHLTPDVCVRHGERGVLYRQIRPVTPPRPWLWPFALVPALFLLLWLAVRHRVTVAMWPFCGRCCSRRRGIMAMSLLAPLVPFAWGMGGALVVSDEVLAEQIMAATAVATVLGLIAGGVIGAIGSFTLLARARVSDDGAWVEFQDPHPRFVAAVAPALQRLDPEHLRLTRSTSG